MAAKSKVRPKATAGVDNTLTAKKFTGKLAAIRDKSENARYFSGNDSKNKFLNIRMAAIFALAKEFRGMSLEEIELLLDSDYYEVRMGAVSIMDFQARDKKSSGELRKELYGLYLRKHDRIDNWDLVDRSAPYVVGGYLFDKSRAPLYKLAKSKSVQERRTAIVSTYFFIRQDDVMETFKIAELLVNDKEDSINKAVGSWIREAGKRDKQKLIDFLDLHAGTMPRVTLRYAVEKLDKKLKDVYMKAKDL
jgi:3-methyladenine DNA glycosylase AlkD